MKNVKLIRMEISNFKGIAYKTFDFGGKSCNIYGDNATGKSSICDAWHWLLFGKNQRGESAFDIKPLDSAGNVRDSSAVTSVTAEILIDDSSADSVSHELKRTYYEKWSQKRGALERTFDGNTSDFMVDGIPMKKSEYEAFIKNEIAGEDVFTLITSLYAFNEGLNMQSRRNVLYDMCGVKSDFELASENEKYKPLKEHLKRYSIEELKKKLNSERQNFNKEKLKIPARIDECRKMSDSMGDIDFDSIAAELRSYEAEREQLSGELIRIANNSVLAAKENELESVNNKIESLDIRNRLYRQNQLPKRDTSALEAWKEKLASTEEKYNILLRRKTEINSDISAYERERSRLKVQWGSAKAEKLEQLEKCPTCGRAFDKNALDKAKSEFEFRKAKKISEIEKEGSVWLSRQKDADERLKNLLAEIEKAAHEVEKVKTSKPEETIQEVIICDLPGYSAEKQSLSDEAEKIRFEIEDVKSGSVQSRALLNSRIGEVRREIERLQGELSRKKLLEETTKRIDELKEYDRELALKLNENDRMQFLCEEFIRYKVSCIEENVNSRFKIARFKLFDVQVNGGLTDCCEATANGVPYASVNHGMAVNLGLDIIETLSEYYGISAPLFIDNAESVTKILPVGVQYISLKVSAVDKELRIEKFENSEREAA